MDAPVNTAVVVFPETQVSPVAAYLRGLPSDGTRRVYGRALRDFGTFLNKLPITATRRDVESWRAHLELAGRAPSTISKNLSAISGFLGWAVDEGIIERNPAASARRPKLSDASPRRALSPAEVAALLAVPDADTLVGLRDRAVLVTLLVQAWRLSELLGLRVEDLAEEQGHRVATVKGKGGTILRVPLAAATVEAISTWTSAAAITTGPVFVAVLRGGHVVHGAAMSAQATWKRVGFLAKRAGITRRVHPHLFRHTSITVALANGVPLHSVQDHARHRDPRTTRRYDSHRNTLANPAPHVIAGVLLIGDANDG